MLAIIRMSSFLLSLCPSMARVISAISLSSWVGCMGSIPSSSHSRQMLYSRQMAFLTKSDGLRSPLSMRERYCPGNANAFRKVKLIQTCFTAYSFDTICNVHSSSLLSIESIAQKSNTVNKNVDNVA